MATAAAHALLWRRHRWTALRSLLLVALLHRLHCLAFLAASSPVWLLAAFLLGVVLVHSEPHVPLAAATEDEDRHLYKKIRRRRDDRASSDDDTGDGGGSSSDNDTSSSMEEEEEEHHHLAGEKEEAASAVHVAWTADDEHSIRSIGSLELERDARLEKLMSRRSSMNRRNLIDLDVHIPAAKGDLHHESPEPPGSAPSFLLAQHNSNPFDFPAETLLYRRHESFTAGAPLARPSRFRPYFVADVPGGGAAPAAGADNSNSSSSRSSAASIDHQQGQAQVQVHQQGQAQAAHRPTTGPAVDVELISDSSDDDMSLPGDNAATGGLVPPDEDVEDSFEVESITQQVAAAGTCRGDGVTTTAVKTVVSSSPSPPGSHQEDDATISSIAPTTMSVEEKDKIREEHHILGPVPVIHSSAGAAGAGHRPASAAAASPPTPAASSPPAPLPAASASAPAPAPAPSGKPSSKSKASSKKAVFGFFRK